MLITTPIVLANGKLVLQSNGPGSNSTTFCFNNEDVLLTMIKNEERRWLVKKQI